MVRKNRWSAPGRAHSSGDYLPKRALAAGSKVTTWRAGRSWVTWLLGDMRHVAASRTAPPKAKPATITKPPRRARLICPAIGEMVRCKGGSTVGRGALARSGASLMGRCLVGAFDLDGGATAWRSCAVGIVGFAPGQGAHSGGEPVEEP